MYLLGCIAISICYVIYFLIIAEDADDLSFTNMKKKKKKKKYNLDDADGDKPGRLRIWIAHTVDMLKFMIKINSCSCPIFWSIADHAPLSRF